MGKIFVVTEGEYDDYRILGVTTDRVVAERMAELHDDGFYTPDIEEYDDTTAEDIADEKPAWNITIWDGGRIDANRRSIPYDPDVDSKTYTRLIDHTYIIVGAESEEEAIEEAKKWRDEHDSNN